MKNRWVILETDANLDLMSEVLGVSQTLARVMANRGLRTKKTAQAFLKTSIDNLHPFLLMKDALKALERIKKATDTGEKITVYGDYDVDGMTSTAILCKVLTTMGANVSYYMPHRITEGYGLNRTAVQKLAENGTELMLCVDNGISAVEEIALAKELGMETVIIDHHEPGEILPDAVAIIDPKQPDCTYPFKELCAGGLAYKFAAALCEYIGVPFSQQQEFLALASLATVCDIVQLTDENRVLANCGMVVLNANKLVNSGLGTLITMRGLLEKPIDTTSVGFILGPCLNAAGRLDSASIGVELLLAGADDTKKRMELAEKLTDLNNSRKDLTSDSAERLIKNLPEKLDKVLVLVDMEAHESIAGIVAGRVRDATGRPAIVLTPGDGAMKGSGRSNDSYNMFEALQAQQHMLIRFGGHFKAAGLTLQEENIPLLREALNSECVLVEEDFFPMIEVDAELDAKDITISLANELLRLAPFGSGNHEPLFVTRKLYVENVRVMDEKSTLIFTFRENGRAGIKGIAFGLNEQYAKMAKEVDVPKSGGFFADMLYNLEINEFRGNVSVQLRVRDFLFS